MLRFAILLGIVALVPVRSGGDTVTEATISVDASTASEVALRHEIVVRIDGSEARSEVAVFLHRDVRVLKASSGGKPARVDGDDVARTSLRKWSLDLGRRVEPGQTCRLTIEATVGPSASLDLRVGPDGGYLPPGSGWFPATFPVAAERAIHTTSFVLPPGAIGIGAGIESGAGVWKASTAARPFAVWGKYDVSEATAAGSEAEHTFRIVRPSGRAGERPELETIARLIDALTVGVGEAAGEGVWTLVDRGEGRPAGGLRTLFWDEQAFRAAEAGGPDYIQWRDVSGALAASFWTESLTFRGDLAAWLSRGMQLYLGDVAAIALDTGDFRTETESVVIGSRRGALIENLGKDRALSGLVPAASGTERVLATRGALVAHLAAEAGHSRSIWLNFLGRTREQAKDQLVSWLELRSAINKRFPGQHAFLEPWLHGTELPAFRITEHGAVKGTFGGERYRVEVENYGAIEAVVEVSSQTADGNEILQMRLPIAGSDSRAVLFAEKDRIGRIVLEPRGVTPQSALVGQVVELAGASAGDQTYVPAFPFETSAEAMSTLADFSLDLAGFSIRDFNGSIQWFKTHHGPSGASLVGTGTIVIEPPPPFAAGFGKATGRESHSFPESRDIFIRFPLETWSEIKPQLRGRIMLDTHDVNARSRRSYTRGFDSYFSHLGKAELPPPGAALVTFVTRGNEPRGFVMRPRPDGKVESRFWQPREPKDVMIWEEVH